MASFHRCVAVLQR